MKYRELKWCVAHFNL